MCPVKKRKSIFTSVDAWEDAKKLLYDGWYTRLQLSELIGLSPRQTSRIIDYLQARGYRLVQSDEYEWHLEDLIPDRKRR